MLSFNLFGKQTSALSCTKGNSRVNKVVRTGIAVVLAHLRPKSSISSYNKSMFKFVVHKSMSEFVVHKSMFNFVVQERLHGRYLIPALLLSE